MHLRQVTISDYKNLKDFTLRFNGDGFIDVFVGRNGSGKSNFLEALVRIYDHLLDFDPDDAGPGFDYLLAYEIEGRETRIEWRGARLTINGAARRTLGRTPQVDTVIVYYSGQNRHIAELIRGYESRFRRRIRGADLADTPRFIGIGPDYKQLLILLLLLLPEERQARRFMESKLGVLGTGGTAKVSLSRPTFAARRDYDHLDPNDLFWGLQGVTRAFVDDLIACIEGGATPGALHDRDADRYTIEINAELFRRRFAGRPGDELFRLFNNLRILGMLADVSMPVMLISTES